MKVYIMIEVSKLYFNRYGKYSDKDFSKVDVSDLIRTIVSRASIRKFSKKISPKNF